MQRRQFITLLGGAAAAWPVAAGAQQPAMPVIGFLYVGSPEASASQVGAFRKGLGESGYVEGRDVAIEYRWARNDNDRLPELAADLVGRRVAVIAALGSTPAALAAKAATTTIPIVFMVGGDPVQIGLVASYNRPGGNITGVSSMNVELWPKRLGILHELLPGATRFAVLVDPNNPGTDSIVASLRAAAVAIGRQIEVLTASTNRDIDMAFASLAQKRIDALLVSTGSPFNDRRAQLATLAARYAMPTFYGGREEVEAGGLMSYATSFVETYLQAGIYAGRILKGEKPANLPVLQPKKFNFVINLHTARLLGLEVPPGLLAIADEVIE